MDHGEHGVEPVGQLGLGAAPGRGSAAAEIFFFARVTRAAIVGSETRNAWAISAVVRPQTSRSVSATCASRASAGWQQVKTSRSRSSGITSAPRSSAWLVVRSGVRLDQQRQLGPQGPVPAVRVERLAPGGGGEPGARVVRHAVARPRRPARTT